MSDLYERARAGLALVDVPLPERRRFLGGGCFAEVYETDDGRAVKITRDGDERYAAHLVMLSPQPHLVRVDHVFAMDKEHTVIVVELCEPLRLPPGVIFKGTAEGGLHAELGPVARRWGRRWTGGHIRLGHTWEPSHPVPEEELPPPIIQEAWRNIALSLRAAGILDCSDVHSKNVMQRPGTGEIVLVDLGCTVSSEERPPSPLPTAGHPVSQVNDRTALRQEEVPEVSEHFAPMPF